MAAAVAAAAAAAAVWLYCRSLCSRRRDSYSRGICRV